MRCSRSSHIECQIPVHQLHRHANSSVYCVLMQLAVFGRIVSHHSTLCTDTHLSNVFTSSSSLSFSLPGCPALWPIVLPAQDLYHLVDVSATSLIISLLSTFNLLDFTVRVKINIEKLPPFSFCGRLLPEGIIFHAMHRISTPYHVNLWKDTVW